MVKLVLLKCTDVQVGINVCMGLRIQLYVHIQCGEDPKLEFSAFLYNL